MYRTVRDNVLAAESDAAGCLVSVPVVIVVVVVLLAKTCGLSPEPRPIFRKAASAPELWTDGEVSVVETRSTTQAAWDKARGVWRALRDE